MSWKRLATFVAGGACIAVGFLVPPTAAYLVPTGALLIGYAKTNGEDRKRIRELEGSGGAPPK